MSLVIFIVMLVVLIVGHEFGHFIVAKLSRMKVLEFGVGFPPKLWGKKIGETEYTVNALPFGGFVKIFGEDEPGAEGDPAAFSNRSKLAQAGTLAAGPFANLVIAFVLSTLAFMIGVPVALDAPDASVRDAHVVVTDVFPGSPAERAGLMPGDRILSAETPEAFSAEVAASSDAVSVLIGRDGAEQTLAVVPKAGLVPEEPARKAIGVSIGLIGMRSLSLPAAIAAGFSSTIHDAIAVALGLVSLIVSAFSLSADLTGLSGPVGIAGMVGDASAFGAGAVLSFAALISINLAVLNFLPFPALDGGRLALLGVEALTRRRVPRAVAQGLNLAGFAILILLMLAVTAHDIWRLAA